MNDAGEVLLTIYERIMATSQAAQAAVHAVFGLPVAEHIACDACNKTTHESKYTQYFYNVQVHAWGCFLCQQCSSASGMGPTTDLVCVVQAAALQGARMRFWRVEQYSMGDLFRMLDMDHKKSCDEVRGRDVNARLCFEYH